MPTLEELQTEAADLKAQLEQVEAKLTDTSETVIAAKAASDAKDAAEDRYWDEQSDESRTAMVKARKAESLVTAVLGSIYQQTAVINEKIDHNYERSRVVKLQASLAENRKILREVTDKAHKVLAAQKPSDFAALEDYLGRNPIGTGPRDHPLANYADWVTEFVENSTEEEKDAFREDDKQSDALDVIEQSIERDKEELEQSEELLAYEIASINTKSDLMQRGLVAESGEVRARAMLELGT